MLQLKPPTIPHEVVTSIRPGQTIYINALNLIANQAERYEHGHCCLQVLMNNSDGEEMIVDLISPSPAFWVVLKILNWHFPSGQWRFVESWETSEEVSEVAIAA